MKRGLLAKLRTNGSYYIISGLLLLVVVPAYQVFILGPTGFSTALDLTGTGRYTAYISWISAYSLSFLIYRALLICAFCLLLSLPFSLHRIIVAQELMAQQEQAAEAPEDKDEISDSENDEEYEEEGESEDDG